MTTGSTPKNENANIISTSGRIRPRSARLPAPCRQRPRSSAGQGGARGHREPGRHVEGWKTERPLIKRHSLRLHDSPRCFPANCINTLQTDTFFMPSAMHQYNLMRLLDIKGNHTWVYMQLNSVQVDSPKYNTIQPYFVVFCSLSINYNLVLIRLYSSYIKVKCSQYQGYIVMLENTSQSFSIGHQCTDVWEIFPQRLFKFLTWFNNYSILTSICSAPLRRTLQAPPQTLSCSPAHVR